MPNSHNNQLPVPPAAATDNKAVELVRVWAAGGTQHIVLAADAWEDPAAWGILLVDLARNVANAYQQRKGRDFNEVLTRLKEGFDAEWGFPTE